MCLIHDREKRAYCCTLCCMILSVLQCIHVFGQYSMQYFFQPMYTSGSSIYLNWLHLFTAEFGFKLVQLFSLLNNVGIAFSVKGHGVDWGRISGNKHKRETFFHFLIHINCWLHLCFTFLTSAVLGNIPPFTLPLDYHPSPILAWRFGLTRSLDTRTQTHGKPA